MHDRSDDFGITALAAGRFHRSWHTRFPTPEAVIERLREEEAPESLEQYVLDCLLLAASPLPGGQLDALWRSAADGEHMAAAYGIDGRQWFLEIVGMLAPALDRQVPDAALDAEREHRPDIIERTGSVTGRLVVVENFSREPVDPDLLRRALRDLAGAGLAELALRFFISLCLTHLSPVSPSLYTEVKELGAEFGYGEFIVSRLEYVLEDAP